MTGDEAPVDGRGGVAADPAPRYGAGKRTRAGAGVVLRSMTEPVERTEVGGDDTDPAEGLRTELLPVLPVPEVGVVSVRVAPVLVDEGGLVAREP